MAGKNKYKSGTLSRILLGVIAVLLWTGSGSMALEVTAPQGSLFIDFYNMPADDFSVDLSAEIYGGIYVDSGYTINVLDGAIVHYMDVYYGGTANIKGGFFDFLGVAGFTGSTISIYGTYVNHSPVSGAYFDAATNSLVADNPSVGWGGTITCIYEGASSESYIPISFYEDIQFAVSNGPQQIDIDVKPGSYPNSINLGSKGVVPVAIFSTSEFDATTIPADTIFLAGAGVAIKGKGKYMAHEEDADGDGLLDLVVQVETQNLDPGQFVDGWACLQIYETSDRVNLLYKGWDEVRIVPSKK